VLAISIFKLITTTDLLGSQEVYRGSRSFSFFTITCTGGARTTSASFAISIVSCKGSSVAGSNILLTIPGWEGTLLEMVISMGWNSPLT
jgi:hypothetical protein